METMVYSHSASVSFHAIVSVPICCMFKRKYLHYPYIILHKFPFTEDIDFYVVDFLYNFHQEKYCNQRCISPCTVYFPPVKFDWTVDY